MTKRGYLPFLPILLGSFFISLFQSENIAWPIFAFTTHALIIFWRCLINVYIKYASGNPQMKIPKRILRYQKITSFVPIASTIILGFIAHLYFFMEKSELFFTVVAYSNTGPIFGGILFGYIFGKMIINQISMIKVKRILFFRLKKRKELCYATQDFINENQYLKKTHCL